MESTDSSKKEVKKAPKAEPGVDITYALGVISGQLEQAQELLHEISRNSALTEAERRRLLGSGVRRYGFIDKVSDVAADNPEFIPPFMDEDKLKELIRLIEALRNISVTLQQMQRMTNDELLIVGDEAFQEALKYYNSVRDASRRRVPDAQALFRVLQQFFRRPRRTSDEPTEEQVLRDVKAGLHGKKDVDIHIKHESPHLTGGEHIVTDETHKRHGAVKASVEEEIDE
jgi:hypothetical protein